MKKVIFIILGAMMVLASCTNSNLKTTATTDSTSTKVDSTKTDTTKNVGVMTSDSTKK